MQRDAKLAKYIEDKFFTGLIKDERARKVVQHAVSMRANYKADEISHLG